MTVYKSLSVIMAALWNRTGHYIFALWFLLLLWSSLAATIMVQISRRGTTWRLFENL